MIKKLNKNIDINTQSGRSMIEMLGVLAVIGVLSIGGIMGYSYGMDKYRANETINDVNLRGLDLLSQLSRYGDINLSEWGTHSSMGYEWGEYGETEGKENVFDMSLLGVPDRVCELVIEGVSHLVRDIKVNEIYIAADKFNCDNENMMVFYFNSVSPSDSKCGVGECLLSGCTYNENKCGNTEYCASSNISCLDAFADEAKGRCVSADKYFKSVEIDKKTYYYTKDSISWWDADAGCRALGRDGLINIEELVSDWSTGKGGLFTRTELSKQIYEQVFKDSKYFYFWTENTYGGSDSCLKYVVSPKDGRVGMGSRHLKQAGDPRYALCK